MILFIVVDLPAEHDPSLESTNAPSLRTVLAGLIADPASFGHKTEESPPSAASLKGVSNSGSTSTVQYSPARPTSPGGSPKSGRFALTAGGRTSGGDLTVEVALERETPSHKPPKEATPPLRSRRMSRSPIRPAQSVRCASPLPHSSPGPCSAQRSQRSYVLGYSKNFRIISATKKDTPFSVFCSFPNPPLPSAITLVFNYGRP